MADTRGFTPRRLAFNALFIAMFVALSLFSVEIMGVKITFDALPVVIAAVLFGPWDAFLVGFLGAALEQLLHYGITVTTLLWILPPAIRGLMVGFGVRRWRLWQYYFVCLGAGLLTSCLNTLVYYIDSILFDYYQYALIFGVFFLRLVLGLATAAITATVALPIIAALKKLGKGGAQ